MSDPGLAASALLHLATGVAFAAVARAVVVRVPVGETRRAVLPFAAWWGALGLYMGVQGLQLSLAAVGALGLEMALVARVLTIPLLTGAACGLTLYLATLFTGRPFARPIVAYYGLSTLLFLFSVGARGPVGVEASPWLATVVYADPAVGPLLALVLASIGLPPLVASAGLLVVAARTGDSAVRYRALLVATSIGAWVGSGLVAQLALGDVAKFVTLVGFGLLAAGAAVLAYRPPGRVQRWLGRATPA